MASTKKRAVGKQAEPQPVGATVPVNNPTLLKISEGMKLLASCSYRCALTDMRSNKPMMVKHACSAKAPPCRGFHEVHQPGSTVGRNPGVQPGRLQASMKSVQNYTCVVSVTPIPPYATVQPHPQPCVHQECAGHFLVGGRLGCMF